MEIKKLVKRILHMLGVEAYRYDARTTHFGRFVAALDDFGIDSVIDVGANEGQFGEGLREAGYRGQILSFEPLTSAYEALLKVSSRDFAWQVHPRCAVGDSVGKTEINISGNSVSSSILPMMNSHSDAAPESSYIGKEKCDVITLDSVQESTLSRDKNILIKIDTQGYEWQVLDGAEKLIEMSRGVLIEMSLVPLYDGQKLWKDIMFRLESKGFTLWAVYPAFVDIQNGRTLQLDGLFFRK